MTEQEQIAHLYRRLGFGLSPAEASVASKLGRDGVISRLIHFDGVDEEFAVSPWSFCWEEGQTDIYLDSFRPAFHWSLRLAMTQRPLQEKLTLFWHDHFAVSGEKVETGPMMLAYLETVRRGCAGKFGDLLKSVSREPAMCQWLDTTANLAGHPNENFAREVLELFTIGIGNYSETDVKEAARAFTGWGIRYVVFEPGAENLQATAKAWVAESRPMITYAFSPDLHDSGPKTILGRTQNWTGEEVLAHLASHPKTSQLIAGKLWGFFGSGHASPEATTAMAATFTSTGGDIRQTLLTMVKHPEFWAEKHVRSIIKSPVDFVVPILRQTGLPAFLRPAATQNQDRMKPPVKVLRDIAGAVFFLTSQQGMQLLFPPDVDGWPSGQEWISSANMTHRAGLPKLLLGVDTDQGGAGLVLAQLLAGGAPKSSEEIVAKLISIFDANLPAEKVRLLVDACEKAGGAASLASANVAAPMLAAVLTPLFASPEFQFC